MTHFIILPPQILGFIVESGHCYQQIVFSLDLSQSSFGLQAWKDWITISLSLFILQWFDVDLKVKISIFLQTSSSFLCNRQWFKRWSIDLQYHTLMCASRNGPHRTRTKKIEIMGSRQVGPETSTLVCLKWVVACVTNFCESPYFLEKSCSAKTQKSPFFG